MHSFAQGWEGCQPLVRRIFRVAVGVKVQLGNRSKCSVLCLLPLLTGCAATVLSGGGQDNEIRATVDSSTLKPVTRELLQRARALGVVANDRSSTKVADHFETHGGYNIKIDRATVGKDEMTGAERRDMLTGLCRAPSPDASVMLRVLKADTGGTVGAMYTSRVKVDLSWQIEVLECRTGRFDAFGGSLHVNLGEYTMSVAEVNNRVGMEVGSKVLAAIGARIQGASNAGAEASKPEMPAPIIALPAVSAPSSTATPQAATVPAYAATTSEIAEVQWRLNMLGYRVGNVDGVIGRRTTDAIRKFQSDNRLPQSGIPDQATIAALRKKTPGK